MPSYGTSASRTAAPADSSAQGVAIMGMIKEFKDFVLRGNVVDLAVGIIIGGAFGKIVSSMVGDVMMPSLGALTNKAKSLNGLFVALDGNHYESYEKAKEAGAPVIGYGPFLTVAIEFLIMAFCVFLLVKGINALHKAFDKPAAEAPTKKECPRCCSSIPLKATRCPQCTSELEPAAATAKPATF
jgi:large conductance mechanosensitive channel